MLMESEFATVGSLRVYKLPFGKKYLSFHSIFDEVNAKMAKIANFIPIFDADWLGYEL